MTDIAGYRVVHKGGPHRYLHDQMGRCVAWTRPGPDIDTTEIRVLEPHVPLPDILAGEGRIIHRRGSYVVHDRELPTMLELLAQTIRPRPVRTRETA